MRQPFSSDLTKTAEMRPGAAHRVRGKFAAVRMVWAGIIMLQAISLTGCISRASSSRIPPDEAVAPVTGMPAIQDQDAGQADETVMFSLDSLASHGLSQGAYLAAGGDARSAWLLAATHLRLGVTDPATGQPREAPDPELVREAEALIEEHPDTNASEILAAFAPGSPLYKLLQAELERQYQTPSATRARQIQSLQASLERLRHLPRTQAGPEVLANIPTFEVVTSNDGILTQRRPAIFGRTDRQTPEFSDAIEFIVLNPWWEVPRTIVTRDKIAQFRRKPTDVARLGYQILDRDGKQVNPDDIDWQTVSAASFPYHLRQAPGPANALGRIKFMFPNVYDVYLHDTPEKGLFDEPVRTFSSGCIRVSDPEGLAGWLLSGTQEWPAEEIEAATGSGRTQTIRLSQPVPVHITYLTAFPAPDGTIQYAGDIYGRDGKLLGAIGPWILAPDGG